MVIGIDLDNTIICYDRLFYRLALERDLIEPQTPALKKAVRDAVRSRPDGEVSWQVIQALAYGPQINEAEAFPGVKDFLAFCRSRTPVYVISHKTAQARRARPGEDLHEAALGWLKENGFFDQAGPGLSEDRVLFLPSRQAKIAAIEKMGCKCFIDDLEETFIEPSFPSGVRKILFDPHREHEEKPGLEAGSSFNEIRRLIFGQAS